MTIESTFTCDICGVSWTPARLDRYFKIELVEYRVEYRLSTEMRSMIDKTICEQCHHLLWEYIGMLSDSFERSAVSLRG